MKIITLAVTLLLFFSGCSNKHSLVAIYDLEHYPQNSSYYSNNINSRTALLPIQKNFKQHYFKPWNISEVPASKLEAMWALKRYKYGNGYGENLLLIEPEWFSKIEEQSNFSQFGSKNLYAISLHFSHLRAFPTHKPLFSNPNDAGEGFPFDYMQNSGVHSNEPIFVSHYSKDGSWVYVFTSYASGWLRSRDIAILSRDETLKYQENDFLHVNQEYVPLKDRNNTFITYGRVGMLLPLVSENSTYYTVLAYSKGRGLIEVSLPHHSGSSEPLMLNSENLTGITNELMGRKYGWGGMYEERDCSSTLRDIYASFGIWLPRNSSKQSGVGRVISLENLSDDDKVTLIKKEAVPFETILYRRGHVLLYLGTYSKNIVVFHDTWGIRTLKSGIEGRKIIGKTIISTLKLGSQLSDYSQKYEHLKNLKSMNIITQ
ncbi:MAG: SH3 domain-containing protein [Campylobacterota bacterium]|nr:SH3 domain-containing protein [Campylobacterota bacterium]